MEGKWATTENETGERVLKQHYFIEFQRLVPYAPTPYEGNKMLCNKGGIMNEREVFLSINQIEGEDPVPNRCKQCQRILNTI